MFQIIFIIIIIVQLLSVMADKAADQKIIKKQIDVVSQDRNWVKRIDLQMGCEQTWDKQWGYLSRGFSPQKANIKPSIDDKIQQLQQEVSMIDANLYQCSNQSYGKSKQKSELFKNDKYNMKQNKELRPLQRRLPKNWKKQKWTPPVDPYDPLNNLGKKKK